MFMGMNFHKASFSGLHAQHEKLSDLYQQYEEFFDDMSQPFRDLTLAATLNKLSEVSNDSSQKY